MELGHITNSFGQGNEPALSINGTKLINQINDYQLLRRTVVNGVCSLSGNIIIFLLIETDMNHEKLIRTCPQPGLDTLLYRELDLLGDLP